MAGLDPEDIASHLDDLFTLLPQLARRVDGAQRSLRATVEWSDALLTEDERRLLRRMGAFVGRFDLGAIQGVCAIDGQTASAADDLSEWAEALDDAFFLAPDGRTVRSVALAVEWARGQQYRPGAVNAFADDPDAYLVAHAHAHGFTVVTHEIPGNELKRVKIPNACAALNVPFANTFELLRREKVRFLLGGA